MSTFSDAHTHADYVVTKDAPILRLDAARLPSVPAQTNLVFYHGSGCPDGLAAAFAAWLLLGERAEYVAVEHPLDEAALPDVRGKHVVVLDYCFKEAVALRMLAQAASFLTLDHHASAVKELAAVPEQSKAFEMHMSGCTLAWSYFHPTQDMPLYFRYLEDKDIWRWAFRGAEAFTAAFSAKTFAALDELRQRGAAGVDELIARGETILAYKNGVRDSHVKRAVPCTLLAAPRFKGRLVNASTLASEIGNQLCKEGADMGVVWCAWGGGGSCCGGGGSEGCGGVCGGGGHRLLYLTNTHPRHSSRRSL